MRRAAASCRSTSRARRRSRAITAVDDTDAWDLTGRLLTADAGRDPAGGAIAAEEPSDEALRTAGDHDLAGALRAGGWSTAGILFGLNLVDEFDRIALLVLGPDIQDSFELSDTGLALLNGIGSVMILAGAIPFGLLADRANRTRVVAASSAVWSVFALLGGLATSAWQLAATRVFNGIGKGNGPVHASLLADQYPIAARGRVFALHNLANPVGGIVGPALAGAIAALAGGAAGWRWSLVLLALPCLVLSAAALSLREPVRGRLEQEAVLVPTADAVPESGGEDGPRISLSVGFERLKRIRTFSALMTALGVLGFTVFGAPTVFNLLLEDRYGLGAFGRGMVSSGVAVGAAVGAVAGGRISDRLFRDDPSRIFVLVGQALVLFAVVYPIGLWMPSSAALTVVHAVAFAFVLGPLVSLNAVLAAIVPARLRGLGFAVVGMYLFLVGGLIGGVLIGAVSERLGERTALVLFVPASCVVAAIVLAVAAKHVRRDIALVVDEVRDEDAARRRSRDGDAPLLEVRNLDFSYGQVQVLFDVELDVREGEVVALLGTNGAGKSTVLRAISGLSLPDRGAIRFGGRSITDATPGERVAAGIVQVPGGKAVFPSLTVGENLLAGAHSFVWDTRRVHRRVDDVLALFPQLGSRLDQPAGTLSGGEQQMLALAKALLLEPRMLLVDELSLGLAPKVVQELLAVVEQLKLAGTTILLVEQSVNVALSIADRAVFMEKGQVRFEGPADDLLGRDDLIRAVFLGAEGG